MPSTNNKVKFGLKNCHYAKGKGEYGALREFPCGDDREIWERGSGRDRGGGTDWNRRGLGNQT